MIKNSKLEKIFQNENKIPNLKNNPEWKQNHDQKKYFQTWKNISKLNQKPQ